MKVKIYVDWDARTILNEKEKEEWVDEMSGALERDGEEFEKYLTLDRDFSIIEVWEMDRIEKLEVEEEFSKLCKESAEAEFETDFCEVEIEV